MLELREGQTSPGVIAVITPFRAAELQMTSYVYNEAKPEVGVVLPAVPLSDIVPGQPVHLVGVPITTHSRTLLRIYAMSSSDTDVLVRVFDAKGAVLAADSIHLFGAPVPANGALALRPAYAEYRLTVDPAAHTSTSIDVEPLAPDASVSSMIWAFATTTGAGSESVTAVFPAR